MPDYLLDDQFSSKQNFSQKELNEIRIVRNKVHELVGRITTARVFCFLIGVVNLISFVVLYLDQGSTIANMRLNLFRIGIVAIAYLVLGFFIKKQPKQVFTIILVIYSINTLYSWSGGFALFWSGLQILFGITLYRGLTASIELAKQRTILAQLDVPKSWLLAIDKLGKIPTTRALR